jgi:hypothetical protein
MDDKTFEGLAARLSELAVTVDDAAEILGTSAQNLRGLASRVQIPHVKLFGALIFERQALEAWLQAKATKGQAQLDALQAKQSLIARAAAAYGIDPQKIAKVDKPKSNGKAKTPAEQAAALGASMVPQMPAEAEDADGKQHRSRDSKPTATSVAAAKSATKKTSTVTRKRAGQ